jgi:hypothetical protein
MKMRIGFISNSSSSSFIVFSKEKDLYSALIESYDDFMGLTGSINSIGKNVLETVKEKVCETLASEDYNYFEYNEEHIDVINIHNYEKYQTVLNQRYINLIKIGYNMFCLHIPDFGDGGDFIQDIMSKSLESFNNEKIKIFTGE